MATYSDRAKALLEALSDAAVPPPMLRDTMEEFLNKVDDGTGTETLAEEFLTVFSRMLENSVVSNARQRASREASDILAQAEQNARGKLPDLPERAGGN